MLLIPILKVNPKAAESLADPEEFSNLFEDWQVALAVESKLANERCFMKCYDIFCVSITVLYLACESVSLGLVMV